MMGNETHPMVAVLQSWGKRELRPAATPLLRAAKRKRRPAPCGAAGVRWQDQK